MMDLHLPQRLIVLLMNFSALAVSGACASTKDTPKPLVPAPVIQEMSEVPGTSTVLGSAIYTLISLPHSSGSTLFATLVRPQRKTQRSQKSPAILLLEGSGYRPQVGHTRAELEEFWSTDPFLQLAAAMAEQGFVVMHLHKRGTGLNPDPGAFFRAGFHEHSQDARVGLDSLINLAETDPSRVSLFGQGTGGLRALQLAAEDPVVHSIVLFGVPFLTAGRSFIGLSTAQLRFFLREATPRDLPEAQLEEDLLRNRQFYDALVHNRLRCEDFQHFRLVKCEETQDDVLINGITARFFREIYTVDAAELFSRVAVPVLFLGGQADWVVSNRHAFMGLSSYQSSLTRRLENAESGNKTMIEHALKNSYAQPLADTDHFLTAATSREESLKLFLLNPSGLSGMPVFFGALPPASRQQRSSRTLSKALPRILSQWFESL